MKEIEIYQAKDKQTHVEVKFEQETVWPTQAQIVELFQTTKSNISEHTKHIFEEGELDQNKLFGISEQFGLKVKADFQGIGTLQP